MPYTDYLRAAGGCSVALGAEMAVVGAPGVVADYSNAWVGLLLVPFVLAAIPAWAVVRHGASPRRPGEWLTLAPLAAAQHGLPGRDQRRLVRRLLVETTVWIVGVTLLVVISSSPFTPLSVFATGLASVAFGVLQAGPARARVLREERRHGRRYVVAAPPRGFGPPRLGVAA